MQRRKQAILGVAAVAALLILVLLASLAFRPAVLLGIDGNALAHSVDSKLPAVGDPGHCDQDPDGGWTCHVRFEQDPGSGGGYVLYLVTANGLGCWHAVRPPHSRSGDRLITRMHGCLYLWDF